jgi:hypothetical protein
MVGADLHGWLPVMGVNLGEDEIETILRVAEHKLAAYRQDDGTVCFDTPAHTVIATRQ